MTCVSCDYDHDGKFCPNCGEKAGTNKITFASITGTGISSLLEMDKGFLFNLKALLLYPQQIATDYIRGKRTGIQNPISFLIFSVSIYLIVITLLKRPVQPAEVNTLLDPATAEVSVEVGRFIRANLKYFWILSIFPLAASLRLIYNKYSYVEHLAISSFIIGQATLVTVISYLIFKFPLIFDPVVYFMILILVYRIFKRKDTKVESTLLSFSVLFIFIFQLALIIGLMVFIKL